MAKLPVARIASTTYGRDVYEPSDDSFLLVDTLVDVLQRHWAGRPPPRVCLEIGCGSGYVICSLALALAALRGSGAGAGAALFATDVNPAAAAAAAATLAAHSAAAELAVADLAAPLLPRLAGGVDLVLFNPPYVPTPEEEVGRGGIAAAWAGGARGRAVLDRALPALAALLAPRGEALVVAVQDNAPAEVLAAAAALGLDGRVAARRAADEEALLVLHLWRRGRPGGPP